MGWCGWGSGIGWLWMGGCGWGSVDRVIVDGMVWMG